MISLKQILFEITLSKTNKSLLIKKYGEKDDDFLISLIDKFEKFKNNLKEKDIFKYNSYEDIEFAIEKASKTKTQNIKQGRNVKPIYEDENYIVYNPKTHGESCLLGSNTNWCISMKKNDSHWSYYTSLEKDANFYIIINKNLDESNSLSKIAVAVYPNSQLEIYDKNDKKINLPNYPTKILDLLKPSNKKIEFTKILNKKNKSRNEIEFILETFKIKNYKINSDLSVDVKGDVRLNSLNLEIIPIKFNKVGGNFYCYDNKLTSLEGSPEKVGGSFDYYDNKLTSLIGSLEKVGGSFDCHKNNLPSLEGSPKEVGGWFDCSSNNLTSLKGSPEEVGGWFDCSSNTKKFTKEEVEQVSNVKGSIYI